MTGRPNSATGRARPGPDATPGRNSPCTVVNPDMARIQPCGLAHATRTKSEPPGRRSRLSRRRTVASRVPGPLQSRAPRRIIRISQRPRHGGAVAVGSWAGAEPPRLGGRTGPLPRPVRRRERMEIPPESTVAPEESRWVRHELDRFVTSHQTVLQWRGPTPGRQTGGRGRPRSPVPQLPAVIPYRPSARGWRRGDPVSGALKAFLATIGVVLRNQLRLLARP